MSVLKTIEDIKDFIKHCQQDPKLAGFDVLASKHKGRSYVIAKCTNSFKAKYILTIFLDSLDPYERTIIFDTINIALYGRSLDPRILENIMVGKSETH